MIQDAELRIYPGAPHGLTFTHTARVNEDIGAFARVPATGARIS
jgi:non-heme chloroperoxidase